MKTLYRVLFLSVVLTLASMPAFASSITGRVLDAESGEPLKGANVLLEGTPRGEETDAKGQFSFTGLPEGREFVLSASFIGYRVSKTRITTGTEPSRAVLKLTPIILKTDDVVYTTSRATSGETPASFSNVSGEKLREQYWAQDIPPMLEALPGVYSYSEAGTGIGYTYMKVRGFDQKRLGVTVNGIPMNDPEDGTVYWVDTPDLAANLQDAQLRRGVSYSSSGSGGFGGALNLVTLTPGLERPNFELNAGAGSFGTRKWGLSYNSGIIRNTYGFYGRFSQIQSNGYRDNADATLFSYFLTGIRYGERSMLTINVYGGREVTHAAWDAAPESELRRNRKYNPIHYGNTVDNFSQPRYELHYQLQLADNLVLENSLFYVRGEGYYEQYKDGRDLVDFGFHYYTGPDGSLVEESDVVNQKWVEKDHVGYLPRLTWDHGNGELQVGGDIQYYKAKHYGHVIWGKDLPPDAAPRQRYYRYNGNITLGGLFVQENLRLSDRLTVQGNLEGRTQFYRFKQLAVANFAGDELNSFSPDYFFLNPKAGVHYDLTDEWHLYTSLGLSHRSPTNDEYWDTWEGPDDLGVDPLFATPDTIRTANGGVKRIEWSDPTIKPERVIDLELGTTWERGPWSAKLNGYYMDFRNEIVPAGGVRDGSPVTDNADRSVHKGLEAETRYSPARGLQGWLNLSLSDDRLTDYVTYDYDADYNVIRKDLSGNKIALFPSLMAYTGLGYRTRSLDASFDLRHVGRQYLDNTENDARSIDPFTLLGFNASWHLPYAIGLESWDLKLRVNNILDTEYETAGWYDPWAGENFYFVGATRNWFLGLTAKL